MRLIPLFLSLVASFTAQAADMDRFLNNDGCNDQYSAWACITESLPSEDVEKLANSVKSTVTWELSKTHPENVKYFVIGLRTYEKTDNLREATRAMERATEEDKQSRLQNPNFKMDTVTVMKTTVDIALEGTGKTLAGPVFETLREFDRSLKAQDFNQNLILREDANKKASWIGVAVIQEGVIRMQKDPNIQKLYDRAFYHDTRLRAIFTPQQVLDYSPTTSLSLRVSGIGNKAHTRALTVAGDAIYVLNKKLEILTRKKKADEKKADNKKTVDNNKVDEKNPQKTQEITQSEIKETLREIDDYKGVLKGADSILSTCYTRDCRESSKVLKVATETLNFTEAIVRYNSDDEKYKISGLAMSAATMNFIGVGMALLQGSQKSESQMILEQLQVIQAQIRELKEIMVTGFERARIQADLNYKRTMLALNFNWKSALDGNVKLKKLIEKVPYDIRERSELDKFKTAQNELAKCLNGKINSNAALSCWSDIVIAGQLQRMKHNAFNASHAIELPLRNDVSSKLAEYMLPYLYADLNRRYGNQPDLIDPVDWMRTFNVADNFLEKNPRLLRNQTVRADLVEMYRRGLDLRNWYVSLIGGLDSQDLGVLGKEINIYRKKLKDYKLKILRQAQDQNVHPFDINGGQDSALTFKFPNEIGLCENFKTVSYAKFLANVKMPKPLNLELRIHPELRISHQTHNGTLHACYKPVFVEGYFGANLELSVVYRPAGFGTKGNEKLRETVAYKGQHGLIRGWCREVSRQVGWSKDYESNMQQPRMVTGTECSEPAGTAFERPILEAINKVWPKFENKEKEEVEKYRTKEIDNLAHDHKVEREQKISNLNKQIKDDVTSSAMNYFKAGQSSPLADMSESAYRLSGYLNLILSDSQLSHSAVASALALPTFEMLIDDSSKVAQEIATNPQFEVLVNHSLDQLEIYLRDLKLCTKTFGTSEFAYQLVRVKAMIELKN